METSSKAFESRGDLAEAIECLEEVDTLRNKHAGFLVLIFFISAAISVFVFFVMSDISLWGGDIGDYTGRAIVILSWVLIFPVWILLYLAFLFLLGVLGLRDVRSVAKSRLTDLALGPDELNELLERLGSRDWRHRKIFNTVISDMLDEI